MSGQHNSVAEKERRLGVWEKYLSLWVALCIGAGIGLGEVFPQLSNILGRLTVADVSIPVAICLYFMIYHGANRLQPGCEGG